MRTLSRPPLPTKTKQAQTTPSPKERQQKVTLLFPRFDPFVFISQNVGNGNVRTSTPMPVAWPPVQGTLAQHATHHPPGTSSLAFCPHWFAGCAMANPRQGVHEKNSPIGEERSWTGFVVFCGRGGARGGKGEKKSGLAADLFGWDGLRVVGLMDGGVPSPSPRFSTEYRVIKQSL
jgi:hypothetical protein